MYKQITENKTKTYVLFLFFFVFVIGVAWVLSYVFDIGWLLPIAVMVSIIQAFIGYYYSDKIALATNHAVPVEKKDNPYLYRMVENLAITAGIPKPAVYIIPDSAINAFATGRDPQHASIAVTQGALDRLENEELEGVLAHEFSHVGNYDIRISTIAVVLVGTIALLSNMFTRSMWLGGSRRRSDNEGGQAQAFLMIFAIVLALLAPLAATLLQLALSRKREYLADASGALLTRYPEGLASALEKIGADKEPLEAANQATAHMYFANPLKSYAGAVNNLFSTHPPIEDRIRRLREMA